MKEVKSYDLYIFKKASFTGICLGLAILLYGIFGGNYNHHCILLFLGIGIINASAATFGFGMCLNLMAETSDKSKGNNTSPCKDNLYYFLEKQRFYYY